MKKYKTLIPTRIDINKDKIYRVSDIHDFACLVFPHKNAKDLRAACILIFLGIKYSLEYNLTTQELEVLRKRKLPEISQKSLWKARATMARMGLIVRTDRIFWKFSSRFTKSLTTLSEKVSRHMAHSFDRGQREKEWFLLDYVKAQLGEEKSEKTTYERR